MKLLSKIMVLNIFILIEILKHTYCKIIFKLYVLKIKVKIITKTNNH